MTFDDALWAVQNGSYRLNTELDLRAMLRIFMDFESTNPRQLHQITHAAALIREELAAREAARLAKPHWSVVPNFWLSLVAALGAFFVIMDFVLRWFFGR